MCRTMLFVLPVLLSATTASNQALGNTPDALMAALERLDTHSPIQARLSSELWHAEGKGEDREEHASTVTITMTDGTEGFSLRYSPTLLKRMNAEAAQLTHNPDAKTPLRDFLWRLELNQLRPLLSSAQSLRRTVERAHFREAVPDEYAGQSATRLIYTRNKSVVHERMRQYIKDFHSTLEVWVDDEGTPLASRIKLNAEGSILFVIRGKYQKEVENHYSVEQRRLLTTQREEWQKTNMPGEHHESRLKQSLNTVQATQ